MKEFTTALVSHVEGDSGEDDAVTAPVTFKIDDRVITFRGATSSEVFMLMAAVSDTQGLGESIATSINVLYELMSDEDRRWLKRRLFDRRDPMRPEHIAEYISALVEEWSGNPTESPSDSSPSPSQSGRQSKGKRRSEASTSSA